jgi:acetyltransferase
LAGGYEVFSAALRQAGAVEAKSLEELFSIAKALVWQPELKSKRIGVITNGGGAGVLLTDYLYGENFELPDLDYQIIEKIKKDLHPDCSRSNPLDIVGDATSKDYRLAVNKVLKQSTIDGLVVILTLQIMTDPLETAKKIVKIRKDSKKPIFTVFMGSGQKVKEAVKFLEENKIPNYSDPEKVAKPLKALINKKDE